MLYMARSTALRDGVAGGGRAQPSSLPTRRRRHANTPLATAEAQSSSSSMHAIAMAKARLRAAVVHLQRGADASPLKRGEVEEALVALEALAPPELDWSQLEGCWRLMYTTAADVLPLVRPQLQLGPLPLPAQVGRVWQRFSSLAGGRVQNIIELRSPDGLPVLGGCTALAVVVAGYEQRTARSIALSFQSAGLQAAALSPSLQNLLASPLLPRGQAQLAALQALRGASISVPLPQQVAGRQRSGGGYSLTWLDGDMLVGRAQGSGGSFVFDREGEGEVLQQLLGEL